MDLFTQLEGVKEITAKGMTKSSVRFEGGIQADLRVVSESVFIFPSIILLALKSTMY